MSTVIYRLDRGPFSGLVERHDEGPYKGWFTYHWNAGLDGMECGPMGRAAAMAGLDRAMHDYFAARDADQPPWL